MRVTPPSALTDPTTRTSVRSSGAAANNVVSTGEMATMRPASPRGRVMTGNNSWMPT